MSSKTFFQIVVLISVLMASLASPLSAHAWSCGNTYVVQWGDTLSGIAAYCGTTVSAIYAANPGISGYLYAGQVLVMPASYYCNCPQDGYTGYTGTYVVQRGDTFARIAQWYGVSVNNLWAANPYIWDINIIYPGQVLNVPGSYAPPPAPPPPTQPPSNSDWFHVYPGNTNTDPLIQRSYGVVPPKTPMGTVKLIDSVNAQAYISLQGTTSDGIEVINEYPVTESMTVKVPAGWYIYVAWIGGKKFSGQFKLGGDSTKTLTLYISKVVVE